MHSHKEEKMGQEATPESAARELIGQMTKRDRAGFVWEDWAEGVSTMCVDDWSHLTETTILDAVEDILLAQACPDCGEKAKRRICSECGREAIVIDCGHFAQPAVISAGRADGSEDYKLFCDECAE